MAVGTDMSIRAPRPLPMQAPVAKQSQQAPSYLARPRMISDRTVQAAANNQLAAGFGAREMGLKEGDRAGVSRGRGQQYYANIAQEAADAKGEAGAAQTQMAAAASNAAAQQQYDSALRNESLMNSGLLEGLRSGSAMERLGGRANRMAIEQAIRRGQFGLDSIGLDYSSLLAGLLG